MTDITTDAFRRIREQAHDDAESFADDPRTILNYGQHTKSGVIAKDQAESHGYTGVAYDEYVGWFVQVYADWKRFGRCTHHG